jgi:hypothetical protein
MIPTGWTDIDTIIVGLIALFIIALLLGTEVKRKPPQAPRASH